MSSPTKTGSLNDHRSRSPKRIPKICENPSPGDDHEALCHATEAIFRKIISTDEHFAELQPDCTLEELQSEIALARGLATTIYVKRDGLTTLKVVLPQPNPTIANLKRAIERTANLLQQRKTDRKKAPTVSTKKSSTDTPPRRSGDLVAAATTRAGRPHRSNASWRFLWRAYALSKAQVTTEQAASSSSTLVPVADTDGRQLLSDFGIGHKSVLRFVKRENYFGRQRQRS